MVNSIYRDRIINNITFAIREAQNAARINHPGLIGRIRELAAEHIIRPMLPFGFEVGTGKICDSNDNQSGEVDLIIHNNEILPSILYSERDGIHPIEGSYYSIEIKSKASATNLQDAIRKGREISALNYHGKEIQKEFKHISLTAQVFFAFASDLKEKGLPEFHRYTKYDPDWQTDPVLKAICIVGQGYWYFHHSNRKWEFRPASDNYDEVIDFIGGIVNTLIANPPWKRINWFGDYIILSRESYTIDLK